MSLITYALPCRERYYSTCISIKNYNDLRVALPRTSLILHTWASYLHEYLGLVSSRHSDTISYAGLTGELWRDCKGMDRTFFPVSSLRHRDPIPIDDANNIPRALELPRIPVSRICLVDIGPFQHKGKSTVH
jgi:hypothetical protein